MGFPFIKKIDASFFFMMLLTNIDNAGCQLIINVSSGEQGAVPYRQTVSGDATLLNIHK